MNKKNRYKKLKLYNIFLFTINYFKHINKMLRNDKNKYSLYCKAY